MSTLYKVERHTHGWLVCSHDTTGAIPINAMSEISRLFPKGAIMDLGIPHHFHAIGRQEVVVCVGTASGCEKWRAEINDSLAGLQAQERWWKGLDVGCSAAAIFAVFCEERFREPAKRLARGAIPMDADDFGRCDRLLTMFPDWRKVLVEVARAYPESAWPRLVARWSEIEAADPERRSEILRAA